MINELRQEIKTLLSTIDSVAVVYDYIPEKIDWYPAILFNFDRVESSNQDTANNERIYTFQINILQELSQLSQKEAERNICHILNEVMNVFDRSELWIRVEAVGGDIGQVSMESWPALIWMVLLGIHTIYNLS